MLPSISSWRSFLLLLIDQKYRFLRNILNGPIGRFPGSFIPFHTTEGTGHPALPIAVNTLQLPDLLIVPGLHLVEKTGHIAVSQGTPTVTIFGAQRSVNWRPPEPQHRAVLTGLPCQPCTKKYCGAPLHIACLRTLTVETVFESVLACQPWVPKMPLLPSLIRLEDVGRLETGGRGDVGP